MSQAKLAYRCSRCGLRAVLDRVGWFRDADFLEVFHERMKFEHEARVLRRALDDERRAHLATRRSRSSARYKLRSIETHFGEDFAAVEDALV